MLIAIPPMLLVAIFFRPDPSSAFHSLPKKAKCKKCCIRSLGWANFFLMSCFCCLFMICFCLVASEGAQEEWLVSSLISIGIDLFGFEIAPALTVGLLGAMRFGCKAKCALSLILVIEGYRSVRNYVGF